MLAYSYPLGGVFLSMLYFFLFFIWIWILITVFIDIFRSPDLNGWTKALWVIFVIILPFLGVFVYLIARGGKMQERKLQEVAQQKNAFDQAVREAADASSGDVASQLSKLADLKSQGVLTDVEFETQKAKILAAGCDPKANRHGGAIRLGGLLSVRRTAQRNVAQLRVSSRTRAQYDSSPGIEPRRVSNDGRSRQWHRDSACVEDGAHGLHLPSPSCSSAHLWGGGSLNRVVPLPMQLPPQKRETSESR